MEIILRGRGQGKTLELIKMCHERGGYIVCHSKSEAMRVYNIAHDLEYNISVPLTYDEFINHDYFDRGCKIFYIDNADALLQRMTHVEIGAITMTQEKDSINFKEGMNGGCVRDALKAAKIIIPDNITIPNWIMIEEMPVLCAKLGLEWHGAGQVALGAEPVIILYRSGPDKGHAEFVNDIGPYLEYPLIGVITMHSKKKIDLAEKCLL